MQNVFFALYNKAKHAESANKALDSSRHERMCHAIFLADIVSYTEDCKYDQFVAPVFPVPEIVNMFCFDFCFMALQHILGHFGRGQLT